MIRAFAKVADEFPDWQLVIFGEGPLRESLELIVESLEMKDRVLLPGRTGHVIEELRKSNIFCMSSDYEGMSNSMIEAICVGLPIVTTDVSGVKELVENGKNGVVVPCGDVDKLGKTFSELMSNERLMEEYSRNNYSKKELFRIDTIVNQWEQLIHQVIL